MFRHVVVFTWKPETTDAQLQAMRDGLAGLPGRIPEIADYRFGDDAGISEGNAAFAVTADFASVDDYFVYRDAPIHRAVITDLVLPIVATRAAVQFES
jgi:hypothetical protein